MSELTLASELRCGMVMTAGTGPDVRAQARRIEEGGFDSIWVGDHVSFHVPILESLTLLSFVAAATERVMLGTSIYLVPLRHPTLVAKITGTLDQLAGGRLVLGVGVGGEFPPEFEAVGVPVEERGPRTDEALPLLRRLWTEERVEHEGRFFRFGPVTLAPQPPQPGGPRIWVGGRRGPTFRRAGQLGDGYISHMCSPEQYAANMANIAEHAARAGRAPLPFDSAAFLFTILDDDTERAVERAASMLGTIYQRDFREVAPKYCLLGRPEDCMAQIERFAAAGARHFVLSPLMDPTEFAERAAADLLPALRKLSPPA